MFNNLAMTLSSIPQNSRDIEMNDARGKNNGFVQISSKKYRMLYEQFLRRSALEKKLLLVTIIAAGCMIAFILMFVFGVKHHVDVCIKPECIESAARLLEAMNTNVDPCKNFYDYACGKWNNIHFYPIDEENSWFIDRTRYMNFLIQEILEEDEKYDDMLPVAQAKSFYKMCTDVEFLNDQGLTPLRKILKRLELPVNLPTQETVNNFSLARTLSFAQRLLNLDILVQLSTRFNSTSKISMLSISPATNDFTFLYTNKGLIAETLSSEDLFKFQLTYMVGIMSEFDVNGLTADEIVTEAMKIILLDAQLKLDVEENDDNEELFTTITDLQDYMFTNYTNDTNLKNEVLFDWQDYLSILSENLNITLSMDSTIHFTNPSYFRKLATRLALFKKLSFQRFVWWKIVDLLAIHTTNSMRTHKFVLEERFYKGLAKSTRSFHCITLMKSVFNEIIVYKLSKLKDFSRSIDRVKGIMLEIEEALKQLILNSTWMDSETKKFSTRKIDSMKILIGYPDWMLNSSRIIENNKNIRIIKNEFLESLVNIKTARADGILSLINTLPTQNYTLESNWFVDPTDVNAYYSRYVNSIAIPIGILQFPFFVDGINALNYGAVGSILGHEISHAFDHEGANYIGEDEIKLTSVNKTALTYANLFNCFINQYSNYELTNNLTINGNRTLDENIADSGGVKEAYYAYLNYLQKSEPESLLPGLENFTHQQLFFISFANVWCKKDSNYILNWNVFDEHSPSRFRVIGSLSNLAEFSQVWNCPLNTPMNPENKCNLW